MFKVYKFYQPYFYVGIEKGYSREVESALTKKWEGDIAKIEYVEKVDLDMVGCLFWLMCRKII